MLDWKTLAGTLALVVTFGLSLPGVKAVRAEETADQCTQESPEMKFTRSQQELQQVLANLAAQQGMGGKNPEVVVLNNRGYNYSKGEGPERALLDLERLRAQQH